MIARRFLPVALAFSLLAGCTSSGGPAAPSQGAGPAPGQPAASSNPVDAVEIIRPVEITFWHVQNGPSEQLQQTLIDEFQAQNPNIKINPQNLESYNTIFQKAVAAIQAGATPDLLA